MGGSGAPPGADNTPAAAAVRPSVPARSASIRRLSTEAAELALHLDGLDLADVEEVDSEETAEAEEAAGPPRQGDGETTTTTTPPSDRPSDAPTPADDPPHTGSNGSRRSSRAVTPSASSEALPGASGVAQEEAGADEEARTSWARRTSTISMATDGNKSVGSLFSTGSHGSFQFGSPFGTEDAQPTIGVLKGQDDHGRHKGESESHCGEGDAGAGRIAPTGAPLTRRASTKSIDLGGIDDDLPVDDLDCVDPAFPPSRVFSSSRRPNNDEIAPPSPSRAERRRESPPRYDPEAMSKILGDAADAETDADAQLWADVQRYERNIPGYKAGRNRRASDYADGNDADAYFEKEWGDMVAVTAAGCGRGFVVSRPALRVACCGLAFAAAAVAVGVGTFTAVERAYTPVPVAEMSEEDRVQGALPTPTPPEPPSDLAKTCSVESFSSDPSSELRCKEACTKAECCFVDPRTNAAVSCEDEHHDVCQTYLSYCTALDLEMLGIGARSSSSASQADTDEEAAG